MTIEPAYIVAGPTAKKSGPGTTVAVPGCIRLREVLPGEQYVYINENGQAAIGIDDSYVGQLHFIPSPNGRDGQLFCNSGQGWKYVEVYTPPINNASGQPYDPMYNILNP